MRLQCLASGIARHPWWACRIAWRCRSARATWWLRRGCGRWPIDAAGEAGDLDERSRRRRGAGTPSRKAWSRACGSVRRSSRWVGPPSVRVGRATRPRREGRTESVLEAGGTGAEAGGNADQAARRSPRGFHPKPTASTGGDLLGRIYRRTGCGSSRHTSTWSKSKSSWRIVAM